MSIALIATLGVSLLITSAPLAKAEEIVPPSQVNVVTPAVFSNSSSNSSGGSDSGKSDIVIEVQRSVGAKGEVEKEWSAGASVSVKYDNKLAINGYDLFAATNIGSNISVELQSGGQSGDSNASGILQLGKTPVHIADYKVSDTESKINLTATVPSSVKDGDYSGNLSIIANPKDIPETTAYRQRTDYADYYAQELDWIPCGQSEEYMDKYGEYYTAMTDMGLTIQCADMKVPLIWADRKENNGREAEIAVSRALLPKSKGAPLGSIIMNPGGPGGSGVGMIVTGFAYVNTSSGLQYNSASFDPRGVGFSSQIRCDMSQMGSSDIGVNELYNRETKKIDYNVLKKLHEDTYKNVLSTCLTNSEDDIARYSDTQSVARDMDLYRHLLGDSKINYFGFSYGTTLGQTYASMFPNSINRMALDGVVDAYPASGQTQGFINNQILEAESAETDFFKFVEYCKKDFDTDPKGGAGPIGGTCPLNDGTVTYKLDDGSSHTITFLAEDTTEETMRKLREMFTATNEMFPLASNAFLAFYDENSLPNLVKAFQEVIKPNVTDGDISSAIQELKDSLIFDVDIEPSEKGDTSQIAINIINCATYGVASDEREREGANAVFDSGLLFGDIALSGGYFDNQSCIGLPLSQHQLPIDITKTEIPNVLVISSLGDPATPHLGGVAVSKELAHAQLLTYDGMQHCAYAVSSCAQQAAVSYFNTGLFPNVFFCPGNNPYITFLGTNLTASIPTLRTNN
jgi:pimeloyl-ACP methyl ester carboxylesterase